MSDDDFDDIPEELWGVIDNIEQQKAQTVSQAPGTAFNSSNAANNNALQQHAPWRPQQVQQLPLAPPQRPANLAQQLRGAGQGSAFGNGGINQIPRYPPASQHPAQQQKQQWPQQLPRWGTSTQQQQQQQQHQQQPHHQQQPYQQQHQQPHQQQLSFVSSQQQPAPAAAGMHASANGFASSAAIDSSALATSTAVGQQQQQQQQQQLDQLQQATQLLSPQDLRQQLQMAQKQAQDQAATATQLRHQVMALQTEKQQLQQRLQSNPQQSFGSIDKHRAMDLQKQLATCMNQLMFAEQEAQEAQKKATDKETRAAQVEAQLQQLQHDLHCKEQQMLQLQHELEQERQRVERLTAAGAAAATSGGGVATPLAAAAARSGSNLQHSGAAGFGSPASSTGGRKRRLSGAAASGAAGAAAAASGGLNQLTPLQPRRQQLQQLLQAKAGPDVVMQDQRLGEQQQLQEEQPFDQVAAGQVPGGAAVGDASAAAAPPAAAGQQLEQQQQQQQQQPDAEIQQEQPPADSMASMLIPALQQVQVSQTNLLQLLWTSSRSAMQQLLQPVQWQPSTAASGAAASSAAQAIAAARLRAAVAAVQEQLQALAGGCGSSCASLLALLQLAVVLFPAGISGPRCSAVAAAGPEAAGVQHTWTMLEPPSPPRLQQQQPQAAEQQQQLQSPEQRCLLFQAADDAQLLHILPLPLAEAALQLLQALAAHDESCLGLLAAGLGASQLPGSCRQQFTPGTAMQRHGQQQYGSGSRSSGSALRQLPGTGRHLSSNPGAFAGLPAGLAGNPQWQTGWRQRLLLHSHTADVRGQSAAGAGTAACWAPLEAAVQDALATSGSAAASGSTASAAAGSNATSRSLLSLLADAAACDSGSLLLPAGAVLSALAERLPSALRQLLLAPAGVPLLLQLLQADGWQHKSQALAALQGLLAGPAVLAALQAALPGSASGRLQQDAAGDAVMLDAGNAGSRAAAADAALQLLNEALPAGPPQQDAGDGASPAAQRATFEPRLSSFAARSLLLGVLDCIGCSVEEALRQQQKQCNSAGGSSCSSSSGSRLGRFQLHRRGCAVVAQLLHSKQEASLQLLMDLEATGGYGLAQRLLVMVDAACSAPGGDPFAIAAPLPASASSAAAAATVDPPVSSPGATDQPSSICGAAASWAECLERVRLAHEGLLLLRALVATPGVIGSAAMSDLASHSTSLRLIMTTRAKLSEWTDAILAAAPAPAALLTTSSGGGGNGAAGAAALPLAPWSWPLSAGCGCRGIEKSSSGSSSSSKSAVAGGGKAASSGGAQLLRAQRPLLAGCLQEMSNSAASVHRRVMIFVRQHEGLL